MTLREWVSESVERYRTQGVRSATRESVREFMMGIVRRVGRSVPPFGIYVLEEDWDVLLVLDACRWDALAEVSDEYEWLPEDVPSVTSRGTYSRDWMQENFGPEFDEEKARTAHITWNAFSDYELDETNWYSLNEVWRDVWDDERGLLPPRPITDRAIRTWRDTGADRTLVHYMQPHAPYRSVEGIEALTKEDVGKIDASPRTVWDLLREGELTKEEAWEAYLDNLRWVLNDLELLIENMDAENVVLTADHGDCFGEWSLYGHPHGIPVPELKRVPWVKLTTKDTNQYEPEIPESTDEMDESVEDRLRELGYL